MNRKINHSFTPFPCFLFYSSLMTFADDASFVAFCCLSVRRRPPPRFTHILFYFLVSRKSHRHRHTQIRIRTHFARLTYKQPLELEEEASLLALPSRNFSTYWHICLLFCSGSQNSVVKCRASHKRNT
jgi:hypothetical protein